MENLVLTIRNNFEKELLDMVCRKVKHQDYCHDIMQEVYIKIMANLPKIEQADNMIAYLSRLTGNTVIDYYRKNGKIMVEEEPDQLVAAETTEKPDTSLKLADCCLRPMIDSLPPIYRDALVMVELEGLKHRELAEKAGISLTNAKTRVQRAREKLKEIILQCCNYEFDTYGNIVSCCKKDQPAFPE
ncbi:sigma-70 family RNA polymerase sigma factor [Pseudoflavitalea sp. X16]|uniref:sigma-70 family RNA polymerase sigma factor n=1 Tax=Paraflavitalea devenefica TaxID=2716334 RepID=UPI00142151F3|nr:sigma-70 family RNA polymerase sigma factor [Paraflavitalea devenefica]NII26351.1 sigma-70 family RNA polymerase sigma factor [Paraflavitalea devenefica]